MVGDVQMIITAQTIDLIVRFGKLIIFPVVKTMLSARYNFIAIELSVFDDPIQDRMLN